MADRPYIFFELTNSLCSTCLRKVEAKVIFQEGRVYLVKHCPEHKQEKVLISTDAEYYQFSRRALKPGTMPRKFNTEIERGCPYDCGLCPDHEQHSCLALVEITDHCNLTCPVCYAESSPRRPMHRSLEQIAFMLDCVVRNEGRPDIVQISGGEPTIHPEFFAVLDLAKERPIKHLMVNTNGVRIAQDPDFARRLAEYKPNFEVYLQFDSLDAGPQRALRGADLVEVRTRALEHLNEHGISTTLVVTLKKGLNDDQVGAIIDFAVAQPCVRGVTFQPVQVAGRIEGFDPARDRLTLAEVRARILAQSPAVPAGRHRAGPLPPRLPGHGLRAEARRQARPVDAAPRPHDAPGDARQHDPERGEPRDPPAGGRAVLDVALARLVGLDACASSSAACRSSPCRRN